MQRGNLVIYDETGKIFAQTGECEGDVLSNDYPIGLPYLEIPYGTMSTKRVISIDVTKTPHEPIFVDLPKAGSDILEERITQAEADNLTTLEALAEVYEMLLALQA